MNITQLIVIAQTLTLLIAPPCAQAQQRENRVSDADRVVRVEQRVFVPHGPQWQDQLPSATQQDSVPMRTMRLDLDAVYATDPSEMATNIDLLIQRLNTLRPSAVMVQAFADAQGDGLIRQVYFPTSQLPMRANLFERVVSAIQQRVTKPPQVYAWMPVLSFALEGLPLVLEMTQNGQRRIDPTQYRRLTPFDPAVRARIQTLYHDMATSVTMLDGVAFHDDLLMSDFEDVSDPGLAAMRAAGFGIDILALRQDHDRSLAWARAKGRFMNDFSQELMTIVRAVHGPTLRSARNLFIEPVINPDSEEWYGQNLGDCLNTYDYVMPMLMPYMEGVRQPEAIQDWMERAVKRVRSYPNGLAHTIFELQAEDWGAANGRGAHWISTQTLKRWMDDLLRMGGQHLGYYPDDVYTNHPRQQLIRSIMATSSPAARRDNEARSSLQP